MRVNARGKRIEILNLIQHIAFPYLGKANTAALCFAPTRGAQT